MNPGQRSQPGPMLTQLGLGRPAGNLLIGADGSEFVASLLRSKGPSAAVQELQANYGLQHTLCRPLLQMLDYLDISRREAHMYVLTRARKLLLDWIAGVRAAAGQRMSDAGSDAAESQEEIQLQAKLERLLNASFKYMGVPELQQVPLEVMNTMTHVPAPYLKQLAEDREIFNQLPAAVKQQVYEYDRNLLQQDAVQYIAAYKYELGTILAALNMCQFVRSRPRLIEKTSKHRSLASDAGMGGGAVMGSGTGGAGGAPAIPKPGSGRGRALVGRGPQQQRGLAGAGGFNMTAVLTAVSKDPDKGTADSSPHHPAAASSGLSSAGSGLHRPSSAGPLLPSRKTVRSGSEAIKQLREMVGNSGKVYGHLLELSEVRLKESPSPYLGSKELSYCALRTQLLMSLHDSSLKGPSSKSAAGSRREKDFLSRIREQLPREGLSYDLVWLLDAALIQRRLTVPHLRKLAELFADYLKPPARFVEEQDDPAAAARQPAAATATAKGNPRSAAAIAARLSTQSASGKKRGAPAPAAAPAAAGASGGGRLKKQRLAGAGQAGAGFRDLGDDDDVLDDWQDDNGDEMKDFIVQDELDAEDACGANAANTQDRWLAEAGMVLRDPPAMHMLAAEVVEILYRCMSSYRLPADVPQLPWLLRLMHLGVNARHSLRENQYLMPAVGMQELHLVWPEVLVLLCEGEADAEPWDQNRQRQPGQASGVAQQGAATQQQNNDGWQLLVKEYSRQEVLRKVVQMLCLDRLVNGDLMTARQLLELMLASRHLTTPAAIPEYASFAYSLASVLQDLVKAKHLLASSSFWQVAVGKVLLALVDSDSQVHIEVLRLLLSVAKEVGPDSLAASLGHMLTATAASRARASNQKKKFASITAQYGASSAGHDHGVPGYISLGGAASEWSDGFRTVRSLKYGGSSDGFSELYRKIVVVGGLSDKQDRWPEALTKYMKEVDDRRQQEEEARRAERAAARDEAERQAAGDA